MSERQHPSDLDVRVTLTDFLLAKIKEDELAIEVAGRAIYRQAWSRMFDECEAKKKVVALHGPNEVNACGPIVWCSVCDDAYPCLTLRLIALPYERTHHYREEWKP